MPSIAIVQTAFIGDVVLATPLFETARNAMPGEKIIGVVRTGCENILGNNPFADEIIIWDKRGRDKGFKGMLRISAELRKRGIHTALVPHRSLRTALALVLSGINVKVGFAKGGGAFLHTLRVPYETGIHEVERNLMLAGALGWQTEGIKPAIFPDAHDKNVVYELLDGINTYCVLTPGSVWATKMWPQESYAHVGSVFAGRGISVVISGGPSDAEICRNVAEKVPGAVDACGKLTLRQSAELYSRSQFLLTGDTAPQHLAAAVGARVFSIFGPTVRDFGFWPYTERGVIIEEDIECRPCGVHGHKTCPVGTHACMRNITPEKVIKIINEIIG